MLRLALVASLCTALLPSIGRAAEASAAELLAALRADFRAVAEDAWRGEVSAEGDLWRWQTARHGGEYWFLVEAADGEQLILGRDDAGAFRWTSATRRREAVASVTAALAAIDVAAGPDLFLLPALLAAGGDGLVEPDAATVDGPEPCGAGECWLLTWGRLGGDLETRLWLTVDDRAIERLEIERFASGAPSRRWSVRARPAAASLAADIALLARSEVAFGETVDVTLHSLALRAVDSRGNPLEGLGPESFEVTSGRRRDRRVLPVVAVDWIASAPAAEVEIEPPGGSPPRALPTGDARDGQSVVFFIQPDMHAVRIVGHLRILPKVRELLDSLPPADRAAVVSFDSHLKLWQDFTVDREAVYDAIERAVRFSAKPSGQRTSQTGLSEPGLSQIWDARAARDVARPEAALRMVAEALESVPGEKAMVYLGWSLGRFDGRDVNLGSDYGPAVAALARSRTTVFVLDITDADFHTLEVGLQQVAADTGGTYERTHIFTGQVVRRLARTLTGYYRLSIQADELPADLQVDLVGVEGRVLLRPGPG